MFRCYLRTCETVSEDLAIAFESGTDAPDRVRRFIARALRADQPPRAVLCDQAFLPEAHRATIADLNARNVGALQSLISEGIAAGDFPPAPP